MAARTIRSGIGTYRRKDGEWGFGLFGEEVDVHKDDLARFDRLNPAEPEADETGDGNSSTEDGVDEGAYKRVSVGDMKAEIERRNDGRADDAKVVPVEPGNRPEIVAALLADDEKNKQD